MNSVTLTRRIKARQSIVFDLLTTVEGITTWWSPDELSVVSAEFDARVGGTYRVRFHSGDGREHEASGKILELDAPRRIVMTYEYTLGGEPDEIGRRTRIEFELTPFEGGTDLTFTHTGLATETSKLSHARGWSGAFDKLAEQGGSR